MKRRLTTALTVIGAVTVLVLAANTVAIATTGHGFLLGKSNTANAATTLSRTTRGTALVVKTKSSANSPFAVNGKGRVANLNADKLDGLDSTQLATNTTVYSSSDSATVFTNTTGKWRFPVSPGDYTFTYALGVTPSALPATVTCALGATGVNTAFTSTYVNGPTGAAGGLSAAATVHFAASDVVTFYCKSTSPGFTLTEELPMQITATRITHATLKTIVPSTG